MLTGLRLLQKELETALAAAKKAATEATHHAAAITNAAESQQASFVARLKQLSMQVSAPGNHLHLLGTAAHAHDCQMLHMTLDASVAA